MSGLLDIREVRVPHDAVVQSHAHLRRVGLEGFEGLALWVGTRDGDAFQVRETVVPRQRGSRTAHGVCVTIDAAELHRLNLWLYETRFTIVAQLHSHPTDAYHSDTDDEFPIATLVGSLSLVVPDFAAAPFALRRCATYRLQRDGSWAALAAAEVESLVRIVDS